MTLPVDRQPTGIGTGFSRGATLGPNRTAGPSLSFTLSFRSRSPLSFALSLRPAPGCVPGVRRRVGLSPGVAASCVTDLAELQARFEAVIAGPFNGGAAEGELFSRFFPGGDFVFETCEQSACSLTGITILGIALNVNGAAETALPQTFVLTFADLATQQPVGELGHFDPVTGAGSVTVPDITPGLWAVAATCVGPVLDLDALEAGIRSNGAFLELLGMPCDINSPEKGTSSSSSRSSGRRSSSRSSPRTRWACSSSRSWPSRASGWPR